MIELFLGALGLGLAGLDPAGALIAAGALGAGARERHVAVYALITLLGTAALGTALSLGLGPRIAEIDWGTLASGLWAALVETLLGLGLLGWGALRARRPATRAPKPRSPRGTGLLSLVTAGTLFTLSAILDPTFVSVVVFAGQGEPVWSVIIAHSTWILVSQAPLLLILVAMAGGAHQRFVIRFQAWWAKVRPAVGRVGTGAAFVVGAFFLLDSGWWLVTGGFLVGG